MAGREARHLLWVLRDLVSRAAAKLMQGRGVAAVRRRQTHSTRLQPVKTAPNRPEPV